MDNENKNNFNRPIGTFDFANSLGDNVSKPKDITSDMWVPISAGTSKKNAPPANLSDRQKPVKNRAQSQNKNRQTKKKRPPQSGNTAKKRPPQNSSSPAKKRPPQNAERAQSRPVPQNNNRRLAQNENNQTEQARKAAAKKRRKVEEQREKKQNETERRRYEKASENYNRQRKQGSSREEISKKRAKKKRRSKRFNAVTITAATLFIAVIATLVYCFAIGSPIKTIAVGGKSVYSSDEIVAACSVVPGDNIFTVSEKKVNAALSSSLPYIGSVKIKREFPDKLTVTVSATSEKYLIPNTNGYICLDKNEKILSTKKQKLQSGAFRLDGFKGQSVKTGTTYVPCAEDEKRFESAKAIIAALENEGLKKANVLKLASVDDIIVVYDKRFNIYLGSADNIEKKISLASRVIKDSVTKSNTGYIDVRYDSRAYFNEGNMNQQ